MKYPRGCHHLHELASAAPALVVAPPSLWEVVIGVVEVEVLVVPNVVVRCSTPALHQIVRR